MMKANKLFAAIAASVLTIGSVQVLSADAFAMMIDDIDSYYAHGWEEINDRGHLDYAFRYAGTIDEDGNAVYKVLKYNGLNTAYRAVECPRQNYTQIELKGDVTEEELNSIYDKYSEELDFDEVVISSNCFWGWHNRDENDEFTFRADDVQDKSHVVKKMCADMYRAGIVSEAFYDRYTADIHSNIRVGNLLRIDNYTGDVSELQAFFAEYDESFVVETINDRYYVDIGVGLDEFRWDISDALEERFPGVDAYTGMMVDYSDIGTTTSGTVNILAAVEEESCDINASGAVDLDDAVFLLTHYANTSAGIETASAAVSCDVNGDGDVNLDDAAKILAVYSELSAGLR